LKIQGRQGHAAGAMCSVGGRAVWWFCPFQLLGHIAVRDAPNPSALPEYDRVTPTECSQNVAFATK
jgi:hypothetical protein